MLPQILSRHLVGKQENTGVVKYRTSIYHQLEENIKMLFSATSARWQSSASGTEDATFSGAEIQTAVFGPDITTRQLQTPI